MTGLRRGHKIMGSKSNADLSSREDFTDRVSFHSDIVDHKYRDSGIWDILVGSVFGANDESEGTDASKANSD
jgi:hypothetical protein